MAQVNGRHRNNFEDEVRFDVFYIENWSLALDLKILFKTVAVVVSK
jgi:lipopolysaccharide/colanic/teichoic acid biosynthesis glycosyltransferase